MYNISTETDRPDHEFAYATLQSSLTRGIRVDVKKIDELIAKLAKESHEQRVNLGALYGIANPNSSQQVKTAFMRELSPEVIHDHCTIMGKVTFNKEVLADLEALGYPIATALLNYRRPTKMMESLETLRASADREGLIHPKLSRGVSNRFNYSDPALMNINKSILWDVVIPYTEGNKLYSVDIKQQEPWLIVNVLGIQELIDLMDEHRDFYKALYVAAFGSEPTDSQRTEVKRAWNAMSYGASEQGILMYCKEIDGHVLYNYFSSIPEYKRYKNKSYGLSKKNCHQVKTLFGTMLYAAEQGSKLKRVLMNLPIQGTGSDILALLIEHLVRTVDADDYEDDIHLYYTRHDELIIEVSGDIEEDSVINYLRNTLEHQINDWTPFSVEVKRVSAENNDKGEQEDE